MECYICLEENGQLYNNICKCKTLFVHKECLCKMISANQHVTCRVCNTTFNNVSYKERTVIIPTDRFFFIILIAIVSIITLVGGGVSCYLYFKLNHFQKLLFALAITLISMGFLFGFVIVLIIYLFRRWRISILRKKTILKSFNITLDTNNLDKQIVQHL